VLNQEDDTFSPIYEMVAKRKWNSWRTFWVVWIAMFVVGESLAIMNLFSGGDDTTLSEFVWDFVVVHPVGWVGMAGLLGWLGYHFLFEKDSDDK